MAGFLFAHCSSSSAQIRRLTDSGSLKKFALMCRFSFRLTRNRSGLSSGSLAVATWNHAETRLSSVEPRNLRFAQKRGTMLCKMHMEPRRQILYNIIIPSVPKWGDIMALSEKKAITDKRHQDKLDKIKIQPYKNQGAALRAAAAAAGQSVQGYVLQAVQARMKQEGLEWPEPDKGE